MPLHTNIYKYSGQYKHCMDKTIKEVAKMMDNKINMTSNSVQLRKLTTEQVQMVEEFVNAFKKRMSIFPVS